MTPHMNPPTLPLWYVANQAYMFSNILPVYRALGGEFLVRNVKSWVQFKRYLRGLSAWPQEHTFRRTPAVRRINYKKPTALDGIFISLNGIILNRPDPRCVSIFVGHGTGDKPYHRDSAAIILPRFDYHFLSGPKHLAKLRDSGLELPEEKLIQIGNLRFDDYVNGKIDRNRVFDNLGVVDRTRKTVLYAPTWSWGNGTLLQYGVKFCKELSGEFNVIVRPHTYDRRNMPAVKREVERAGLRHVYFSQPADLLKHDTMDDFLVSDILVSDTSSILYEYLITRKPIIVVRTDFDQKHNMPAALDIQHVAAHYDESIPILPLVQQSLDTFPQHAAQYEELLHNCFYFNDGRCVARAAEFLHRINPAR